MSRRKAVVCEKAPVETEALSLWMDALDLSPDYLRRFSVEELLRGQVTLLYESGQPGGKNWLQPEKSHLWNFNLHYMEFLIPLAAAYRETGDSRYYESFRNYCERWIEDNRDGTGDGWHPYTISLRLTNWWISLDGFGSAAREDRDFLRRLNDSMYAQYRHLQKRLERHLLGNHYFENLKAAMLGSLYFGEAGKYKKYKELFRREMKEQILPDGLHFELSPMYHKLIMEDVMRAAKAVRKADPTFYQELTEALPRMADAMYSLEDGMGRTPLFNDSGDNVARPMSGILAALAEEFSVRPTLKKELPDAGYYILQKRDVKLLFDAGELAPDYMAGHGHCDGLSFELSYRGKPLFVNSGTGQYQGEDRAYFRSTAAHNTAVLDGEEQSECWGEHRAARRIQRVSGGCGERSVYGSLRTCHGKKQARRILWKGDSLLIQDKAKGQMQAYFHLAPPYHYVVRGGKALVLAADKSAVCELKGMSGDRFLLHTDDGLCRYAPEFGEMLRNQTLEVAWKSDGERHEIQISFNRE